MRILGWQTAASALLALSALAASGQLGGAQASAPFTGSGAAQSPMALDGALSLPIFTSLTGSPGATPEAQAQLRRAGEAASEIKRDKEEYAESRAGAEERERSRTAFRSLSDDEALDTLRSEFSADLEAQAPDAETLFDGAPVAEYRGDNVAVLEPADGKPARLVDSPMPLRVDDPETAETTKHATDLDIVASSDGELRAANGPANVALPEATERGIRIGDIRVVPQGSGDATHVDSDTLAYPNVDNDTDLAVNLTASGLETFHQLRSPRAADSQSFRFELPAGARLELAPGGGARVVKGTEELLSVAQPTARDAQGISVTTSLAVSGDRLTIDTDLKQRSLAYPVLVDPEFTVKDDWGCSTGSICTATWFHGYSKALEGLGYWTLDRSYSGYAASQQCLRSGSWNNCYGPGNGGGSNWNGAATAYSTGLTGLHVWAGFNNGYPQNSLTQWIYRPPGTTTQVYRADMGAKFTRSQGNVGGLQMYHGIYSFPAGQYSSNGQHAFIGDWTHRWDADFGSSVPGPQALTFGMSNSSASVQPSATSFFSAYLGAAVIELTDPDIPTIEKSLSGPSGWNSTGVWSVTTTARDAGLGVRRLQLNVPQATGTNLASTRTAACSGAKSNPCPSTFGAGGDNAGTVPFTFSPGDANGTSSDGYQPMPNGVNTITLQAADALGTGADKDGRQHETPSTTVGTVKVDTAAPTFTTLSGALYDKRNQASVHWREGLYDDAATLHIEAKDDPSAPVDATTRSGTKSVRVFLDKNRDGSMSSDEKIGEQTNLTCTTTQCPNGATLDADAHSALSSLPDGDYQVRAEATDLLGQTRSSSWTLTYDRIGDLYEADERTDQTDDGLIDHEVAQINTSNGRMMSREGDEYEIGTHGLSTCKGGAGQCAEYNYFSGSESFYTYQRHLGANATDSDVPNPVDMLDRPAPNAQPTASGDLETVAQPWQTLPPAHGSQFDMYELTVDNTADPDDGESDDTGVPTGPSRYRVWLDRTTKMPIKQEGLDGTAADEAQTVYFSYSRSRALRSDYPSDFFTYPRPPSPAYEENVEAQPQPQQPMGPQQDAEHGGVFTPYGLGAAPIISGVGSFCQNGNDLVKMAADPAQVRPYTFDSTWLDDTSANPEPPSSSTANTPDPLGIETFVASNYGLLGAATNCASAVVGDLSPPLSVISMARDSSQAAAMRRSYSAAGTGFQADTPDPDWSRGGIVPLTWAGAQVSGYLVPVSESTTSMLVDLGQTTVIVRGEFAKSQVDDILSKLSAL